MILRLYIIPIFISCCLSSKVNPKSIDSDDDPFNIKPQYDSDDLDPFDLSITREYLELQAEDHSAAKLDIKTTNQVVQNCVHDKKEESATEAFFKRTINMFLNAVHPDNKNEHTFSGHLFFEIDTDDYMFLRDYANGLKSKNDLVQVDVIMTKIFHKPTHQYLQEYLEGWFHKALNIALSREGIIVIVIIAYLFVFHQLFHARFKWRYVLKFVAINFLIIEFVFVAIDLYQTTKSVEIANKMKYAELPIECNPQEMSNLRFMWNLFKREDECEKYVIVSYSDMFWSLSPGKILTEMFSRAIRQPAKNLGTALGEFCLAIYDSFPFPLNIIILPIILVFCGLISCNLLALIFGVPFKFSFFHLISFSSGGGSNQTQTGDQISGKNVEKLLELAQNRQFVQDVPIPQTTPQISTQLKNNQSRQRLNRIKDVDNSENRKKYLKTIGFSGVKKVVRDVETSNSCMEEVKMPPKTDKSNESSVKNNEGAKGDDSRESKSEIVKNKPESGSGDCT